jgi:hypothetical protein
MKNRIRVVGVLRYRRPSGVQIPAGERDFSLLLNVHTGSRAYAVSYSMGLGVLSRGFNQSSPSNTKVRNEWSYTSLPHTPSWPRQGKLYIYQCDYEIRR